MQAERAARAGAERDVRGEVGEAPARGVARGHDEAYGVVLHRVVHEHVLDERLQRAQLVEREHLLRGAGPSADMREAMVVSSSYDGCGTDDVHEEAVALRLGQRVDALGLDRVLRGEHEERVGQLAGVAADADLALGHRLEQRRLHLGGRAVDLVGEDDVGEHRAPLDVEVLGRRAPDARADEVGRHEVRA